jgi:hypothetical protein
VTARRILPWLVAAVFTLFVLAVPGSASAGPGVVQALPGCTANSLAPNDDGSTGAVALGFTANLGDNAYTSVYVNNNGNVTFGSPLGDYTPFDFRETGVRIIAPFLADVDTRAAGSGHVTYGQVTADGQPALCVNWLNVGYYDSHADKRNSFQLLLVKRASGPGLTVVMNYDTIQWETGDLDGGVNGMGGTSAAAGYSDGTGANGSIFLPGSFANGGLLDSNASTGLAGHGTAGQPAGRYRFDISGTSPPARLSGLVTDHDGQPLVEAPVEICPQGGGPCKTRTSDETGHYRVSGLANGTYDLTARPSGHSADTPKHTTVTISGLADATKDLQLGPPPPPPPAGTTITSIDTTPTGIPVAYWTDPLTLQTSGCPGGTATYTFKIEGQAVSSGGLTESPQGSGHYQATIPAPAPRFGNGEVTIAIDCPGPDQTVDFGIYIDPSGSVRDSSGAPIADARVVLLRSANPAGPFFQVPDGSGFMSPGNRLNPDATDTSGHFGWDVVAGYYKVRASKEGCVDNASRTQPYAESGVLQIPPPVTNLDLRLFCPAASGTGGGASQQPTAQAQAGKLVSVASLGAVKRAGNFILVPVTCARTARGSCAGSITASVGAPKPKKHGTGRSARAKRIAIGRAKFSGIAAGKTKRVKVKLNKKGRRLLRRRSARVKLAVKVHDVGGAVQSLVRNATVPSAKKHKKR